MSRSQWIAAAALMALAVPAAQAGDRTRVQITVAPYWGGPAYAPAPRAYRRGYQDGYRDSRWGGHPGSTVGGYYYGGPVIRFDYRDRAPFYRYGGYRPGGYLRYDSRRDRDYYRGHRDNHRGWDRDRDRHRDGHRHDGRRGERGGYDRGGRGRDWRD
jgi:hypothetical protein